MLRKGGCERLSGRLKKERKFMKVHEKFSTTLMNCQGSRLKNIT
jgi:hypothetical protein